MRPPQKSPFLILAPPVPGRILLVLVRLADRVSRLEESFQNLEAPGAAAESSWGATGRRTRALHFSGRQPAPMVTARALGMVAVLLHAAVGTASSDVAPPLPTSQRCGAAQIAGDWTRTDLFPAFPHTRVSILPLNGTQFAVTVPQLGSKRSEASDPTNGLATVLANGTMAVNCTAPRWCRTIVGFANNSRPESIDTKYIVFGSWQHGGVNCSKILMFNPPGSPGSSSPAILCNYATDPTCPPPPS